MVVEEIPIPMWLMAAGVCVIVFAAIASIGLFVLLKRRK